MVLFQGSSFSFGTSGNPSGSSPLSKTLSTPSLGQTQASTSTTPLFGSQTSAPSTSFGMVPNPSFGGTSAPAPQTTMFGGGNVGQQQPSMFPSSTNTMMTQYQPATGQQMTDNSAVRDLQNIKDSYTTGNTRFQYLFLNVVKDPAARVKPRDIDELQWREALRRAGGPDNPHNLWPVPYNGFKGLLDRKASQNDAVKEHRERIDSLQKSVAAMVNRHETVVRVQIEAIKSRHQ